jgi:hypothetical protein
VQFKQLLKPTFFIFSNGQALVLRKLILQYQGIYSQETL